MKCALRRLVCNGGKMRPAPQSKGGMVYLTDIRRSIFLLSTTVGHAYH